MLMHAFLPILSILGFGIGVVYLASVLFHFQLKGGDFYLVSVLIGLASLILPMTLVGILFEGSLGIVPRVYIVCCAIVVLLGSYHFLSHNLHRLEHVQLTFPKASRAEYVLGILVVIFLLEYLFLLLLFPLRGFDAVERYFPDALVYYQTDSIPKINILTATPTFKPPAHTLLFTYVLYVSGKDTYQLIPFLTIVSFTVLAFKFGAVFLGSRRNGLLSSALLLALPLTRELLCVWAYYQDIYIAFFYSAAVYFFLLAFRQKQRWYSVIAGVATGLAILAKMSGWTLPFILLLLAPAGKRGKALKISILIPVATLLAMKAITTIYVGVAVAIAIIVFILTCMILKTPSQEGSLEKTIIPLLVGIATGGWWMWRMWTVLPQSFDLINRFYFEMKGSPQWTYPIDASHATLPIPEHLHSLSFLGTCLIIFVSAWFAGVWLIPKLMGFLSPAPNIPLVVWCLGFLMIWFAYYFLISVRYLSIVILPLVLLTTLGVERLYQAFLIRRVPRLALEMLLLAVATFQIRHRMLFMPILEPPTRSFEYATNPLAVLLIATGAFLIFIGILIISGHFDGYLRCRKFPSDRRFAQLVTGGLIAILVLLSITAPVEKELWDLSATGWDSDHFTQQFVGEYRPAFQELAQAIITENLPESSIVGASVPGLEFFVQQPVVDLLWGGRPIIEPLFSEQNVTSGLEWLEILKTRFIVSLNEQNDAYEQFQSSIVPQTYLYHIVNHNSHFQHVFDNEEYTLYRLVSYGTFTGLVDLKLQAGDQRTSVFGGKSDFNSTTRPVLTATIDLTAKRWTQMTAVAEVDYATPTTNEIATRTFNLGQSTGFLDLRIFEFPLTDCAIQGLTIECTLFDAQDNTTQKLTFKAETSGSPLIIQYDNLEWTVQSFGSFMLS